jgi:hypothetical protein
MGRDYNSSPCCRLHGSIWAAFSCDEVSEDPGTSRKIYFENTQPTFILLIERQVEKHCSLVRLCYIYGL